MKSQLTTNELMKTILQKDNSNIIINMLGNF